jgi:ribosomal protein S18 acetylase RimI-like enzyme
VVPTLITRPLVVADRDQALAHLCERPRENLLLIDHVRRLGRAPEPGEARTELMLGLRGAEVAGVACMRPSVALDAGMSPEVACAFVPDINRIGVGLMKSPAHIVDAIWPEMLRLRPRRVIVDRGELAYFLQPEAAKLRSPLPGEVVRPAAPADLDGLVNAARESLREEGRPDPFVGDIRNFRRWVRGRVSRCRVVESSERMVYVGYADVQLEEGWLLQGVYTWPAARRQGFAAVGVSQMCREAFAAGGREVQLAVVDDNAPAIRLYEGLGFETFAKLRTILFA